jgi:hypothetical protein
MLQIRVCCVVGLFPQNLDDLALTLVFTLTELSAEALSCGMSDSLSVVAWPEGL